MMDKLYCLLFMSSENSSFQLSLSPSQSMTSKTSQIRAVSCLYVTCAQVDQWSQESPSTQCHLVLVEAKTHETNYKPTSHKPSHKPSSNPFHKLSQGGTLFLQTATISANCKVIHFNFSSLLYTPELSVMRGVASLVCRLWSQSLVASCDQITGRA